MGKWNISKKKQYHDFEEFYNNKTEIPHIDKQGSRLQLHSSNDFDYIIEGESKKQRFDSVQTQRGVLSAPQFITQLKLRAHRAPIFLFLLYFHLKDKCHSDKPILKI